MIDSAEFYETFHEILAYNGIEKPVREVERAIVQAGKELDRRYGSKVPKDTDYYTQWNLGILHRLGIHEGDLDLAEEIDKHWFDYMKIQPRKGIPQVLNELSDRGVKLGIVTNGYISDLEKILPKLGIRDLFEVLVASDSIGKRKPDPEVFMHALRKLRVSPNEAVFVGDEYRVDYVGAQKTGMIPILLRVEGKKKEKGVPQGTNIIRSLTELLSKIGER